MMKSCNKLVLDPFCLRQFVSHSGTKGNIDFDPVDFEKRVNEQYSPEDLKEGYAPFCKHLFIKNFTGSTLYYEKITEDNRKLLQTSYESRREEELPVLKRFFSKEDVKPRPALYLDIILYSKEQIQKENESMKTKDPNADTQYDWGIISVKSQDLDYEIPMDPITCMRNSLGKEEGGSGVPLDREAYMKSVQFWKDHALIQ